MTWIRGANGERLEISDPLGLIPACPKCGDIGPHIHVEEIQDEDEEKPGHPEG